MSNNIKVKIKKLDPKAVTPTYSESGDRCMDLTAISEKVVEESGYGYIEFGTGLAFEYPESHILLIFPRSSISDTGLVLSESVMTVTGDGKDEIKIKFKWVRGSSKYKIGDKVAKFMVIPIQKLDLELIDN